MNDQFDASLVLLRRRFCWSYLDIFYQTYVVRNSSQLDLSPEAEARLLSKQENLGEKLLYDKLNATWWNSPELTQDDFWKEVGLCTCIFVAVRREIIMQREVTLTRYPHSFHSFPISFQSKGVLEQFYITMVHWEAGVSMILLNN